MFPFNKVVTASRGRSFPWYPYQPASWVKPMAALAVCSQGKLFRKPADDASPVFRSFSKGTVGTLPLFSIKWPRRMCKEAADNCAATMPTSLRIIAGNPVDAGATLARRPHSWTLFHLRRTTVIHHASSARTKLPSANAQGANRTVLAFASDLGWMAAIFHKTALARLTFGHRSRAAALGALGEAKSSAPRSLHPVHAQVVERLQAFAAGVDDDLASLEVDYGKVTPFQRRVLDACRGVGPGETLSYGQLAQLAGSPGAARAVGSVMSHNQLPLVVPCHRIVGSGGSLGGYSAPDGLAMKRRLLEREGALVS